MRHALDLLNGRLRDPDGFLGPVLTLISGTAVAHGITAVALLALARLYTPGDLGVLGLYSSIVYTLSVIACLRFEIAIVLPDDDTEALRLLCLAVMAGIALSAVCGVVVAFLPKDAIDNQSYREVAPYLWLLPINLAAISVFAALQNWFVRKKSFGLLARSRIVQSAGAAGTQVGLGFLAPSPIGLIAGFIINSGAATLVLLGPFTRLVRIRLPSLGELRATFRKYRDFPRYSVWEALASSASIQLPILLIGALTSAAEVGQLLLAMTVIQAPMALFGTATAQVFMAKAPTEAREGRLRQFTLQAMGGLARAGIPVLLLLGAAAPFVFPFLFGAEWERAGVLVTWMTPWLLLQFLVSPLTSVLNVTGQLRTALLLQLFGMIFRLGAVWFGVREFAWGANEAYALSGAVFYGAYLIVILAAVRRGH